MVEQGSTSDRARFDPDWMAELETEFRRNLLSKQTQAAIANQGLMYMEQWKLNNHDAQKASHLYFKDRIHAHYTIISQGSGLNFNSLEATLAYFDATKKVTKNDQYQCVQLLNYLVLFILLIQKQILYGRRWI